MSSTNVHNKNSEAEVVRQWYSERIQNIRKTIISYLMYKIDCSYMYGLGVADSILEQSGLTTPSGIDRSPEPVGMGHQGSTNHNHSNHKSYGNSEHIK